MTSGSPNKEDSHIADSSGYVRGFINVSGFWIRPVVSNDEITDCEVTISAHTELGGSIPSSVVNALATTAPMKLLSAIKEIMRKKK